MALIDASAYVHPGYDTRPLAGIIGIGVHHTVSGGQFIGIDNPALTEADEIAHIQMIDAYHLSKGWGGIGYSALIFASGRGYMMGPLTQVRAGVASRNYVLASFAFAGDLTDRLPTTRALNTAIELLQTWEETLGQARGGVITILPVKGHRDWAVEGSATSCPGDRWREWMPILTGEEDDMDDPNYRARRWPAGLLRQAAGHLEAAAGLVEVAWSEEEYLRLETALREAEESLQKAREVLRDQGLGPETRDRKIDTF